MPVVHNSSAAVVHLLAALDTVAYYSMSYEVATKLWLIPSAMSGVLFPAFAASFTQDRNRTVQLFDRGVKYLFLILFPMVLIMVTLAYEGLTVWVGGEFAQNSSRALQWLVVGIFFHCLSYLTTAAVQSAGRPDLIAKLHLMEMPFYLPILWWLIGAYGIEGAAVAWVLRAAVDLLIQFVLARRCLPTSELTVGRMTVTMSTALASLAFAALLVGVVIKALFLMLVLLAFALTTWFLILTQEERELAQKSLKTVFIFIRRQSWLVRARI